MDLNKPNLPRVNGLVSRILRLGFKQSQVRLSTVLGKDFAQDFWVIIAMTVAMFRRTHHQS